jgi:integration host factor subunit beta
MTKADLIRVISVKNDIPFPDAEQAVNTFFRVVSTGLKEGKRIEIRGFGTFQMREYDGYMGRNPRTGETVNVPPKRLPFFKVGKDLRDAVNF